MAYISGHFRCWWNPVGGSSGGGSFIDVGSTREGFRLQTTLHHQPVISDLSGEGQIDGIQQGADSILSCDYIDYDLMKVAMGAQVTLGESYANVGKRLTDLAGTLALKAAAGTPAEVEQGASNCYLFYRAVIADDFEILLASKLRQGPLRFRLFPDLSVSNNFRTWQVTAAPSGVTS